MVKKAKRKLDGQAGEQGRYTAKRKGDAVMRVLRGESLDAVSRELGVTAARLAQWRDEFLAGGEHALKSRNDSDVVEHEMGG